MTLVETPCPVCAGRDYTVYLPATLGDEPPIFGYKWVPDVRKTYRMVRCKNCRHVYASPRLAEMHRYYVDVADESYLRNAPLRNATAEAILDDIRQYVPNGRLLDVGCATGDFIGAARKFFNAEGLELSKWASSLAKAKGLTVHEKLLGDFVTDGTRFDIVTLWGVIEHMEDPLAEMQRIHNILNPGGLVCVWTGDVDSIYARILGANWWYVMGQHIHLFSRHSVDYLLRHAGFEPVERKIYPYVISCEYLADRLSYNPVVGAVARAILGLRFVRSKRFMLKLSSEIFDIYRRI